MRVVHCKREPYTHYIGRPGPFGNPFSISTGRTREEVITLFENFARETPELLDDIYNLPSDAVLGCWCPPKPCHGAVIIKLWEEMH